MKKKIVSLILSLVLILSCVAPLSASASGISVTLNGNYITFDQPPIIMNGRTLVPVRAIFEAMGFTVLWDNVNQIVNVATEFGIMTLGNATLMLKGGISPKVSQVRLGHSDFSTTMNIYSHVLSSIEVEAANKIDNLIFG